MGTEADVSRSSFTQTRDQAQQRGLPAAARSNEADEISLFELEADVFQNRLTSFKTFAKLRYFQDWGVGSLVLHSAHADRDSVIHGQGKRD
ncbi:MAG: hypothetical protein AAGA45_02215 [Verrucomicrobiota bacterium]